MTCKDLNLENKDLILKKKVKKSQKGGNKKVYDLLKKIEKIRNELNGQVGVENKILTDAEILELSQKLDILIAKYMKNI